MNARISKTRASRFNLTKYGCECVKMEESIDIVDYSNVVLYHQQEARCRLQQVQKGTI